MKQNPPNVGRIVDPPSVGRLFDLPHSPHLIRSLFWDQFLALDVFSSPAAFFLNPSSSWTFSFNSPFCFISQFLSISGLSALARPKNHFNQDPGEGRLIHSPCRQTSPGTLAVGNVGVKLSVLLHIVRFFYLYALFSLFYCKRISVHERNYTHFLPSPRSPSDGTLNYKPTVNLYEVRIISIIDPDIETMIQSV